MHQNSISTKPYTNANEGKREQIELMFDSIAPRYDFLNRLLSLRIDTLWRKKAVAQLANIPKNHWLDIATGTADLALAAYNTHKPAKITGIDISSGMLALGQQKINAKALQNNIHLQQADSQALPFATNTFDAVMASFGVRNFENLQTGLNEMHRVTAPGGKVVILEFSRPQSFPMAQLFNFYFRYILPVLGKMVSKNKAAYNYLPQSVAIFAQGTQFCSYLTNAGYQNAQYKTLTFGVATLYTAYKKI